jgi:hypothetical protein
MRCQIESAIEIAGGDDGGFSGYSRCNEAVAGL